MALSYCEHCEQPMTTTDCDVVTVPQGYSYHKKCHKCYVCSETDLADAEIFRGVIFCNGCSKRIFQGCSTVKRTKHAKHRKGRRYSDCRYRSKHSRTFDRVIERAKDSFSSGSETTKSDLQRITVDYKSKNMPKFLKEQYDLLKQKTGLKNERKDKHCSKCKPKDSDISKNEDNNLEVTKEILEKLYIMYNEQSSIQEIEKADGGKRRKKVSKQKGDYSDLRIAELGISTEIANMPLRRKSEVPVILNKLHNSKSLTSYLCPKTQLDSDTTETEQLEIHSSLSEDEDFSEVDICDIIKTPFKKFKKKILNRSSVVDAIKENARLVSLGVASDFTREEKDKMCYEDILYHHIRGVRKLYSTINKKDNQHKLGWPDLDENQKKDAKMKRTKCRHFQNSHSYRCMRRHALKLAGPTESELDCRRRKLIKMMIPKVLWEPKVKGTDAQPENIPELTSIKEVAKEKVKTPPLDNIAITNQTVNVEKDKPKMEAIRCACCTKKYIKRNQLLNAVKTA